jgi:predicted neuraminidase
MTNWLIHAAFILALVGGLGRALWCAVTLPPPAFIPDRYPFMTPAAPQFEREFLPGIATAPAVHSGTLIALPDGRLLAAWFGGSREGAADVAIYGAEQIAKRWSVARVLVDRADTERALGRSLRKLGNPVLTQDTAGRVWLFFVVTSLGGWSTSAIAYKISTDGGDHFGPAHWLVTSPLLNLGTLVRTRPLHYADGSLALPVYQELLGKFGTLLRIAPDGRILSQSRIGSGRTALQPSLVAIDAQHAWALLRRTGSAIARVLVAHSDDGGHQWSLPEPTDLPNPDASVAALNDSKGALLLLYNPNEQGRNILSLARSHDGRHWQWLYDLEQGKPADEFSYPFLIRDGRGDYHLIYTWQRQRMVHIRFNAAWLEQLR